MTDVTGYRDRGGLPSAEGGNTLGGDSSLSRQVHNILTPKLPLLNTPGSVLENTIYYDVNSSSVSVLEEQATFAKDRISLNSVILGSNATAYIPSFLFAGPVFWVGSLLSSATYIGGTGNILAPQGYGFSLLNNIIIYMGSSNIAQIQLSGPANYLIAMACCETRGKREAVLNGAGRFLDGGSKFSPIADSVADAKVFRYRTNGDYYASPNAIDHSPHLAQFAVPLRLPWTSLSIIDKRLSLDTKLLTQPIQIILDVASRDSTFYLTGTSSFFDQFSRLEYSTLQLWQEELSDKSMSVRNELLALPEFNVGLPFQYAQSIDFSIPSVSDTGISSYVHTINLSSIINSDLTTFLFFVTADVRTNNQLGNQGITHGSNYLPLLGERLYDLELKLNGQRFFNFEGDLFKTVYMTKAMDHFFPTLVASIPTSASAAKDVIIPSCLYELNNSRLRSIISESHLQNTCRFTNQTFQLSFKIDRDLNWGYFPTSVTTPKKGFTLHMCYLYNGVFLIGGDGGTSKLITN